MAAVLIALAHWRYEIFRYGVDLGIFTQILSDPSHFSSTVEAGQNHLLAHWSPSIIVAWPFLRFFGPVGLQYFQALAVAATLIPVWLLARNRFAPGIALALAAVCALYPILWANAFGDFHEMALVPCLSATLVYAVDRKRWWVAVLAALALACTKEDQFVVLAWAGLTFAFFGRRDPALLRFGVAAIAIAAIGWFFYFRIYHDALNPGVPYFSFHFFSGEDAGGAAEFLAVRARYVLVVLGTLAFLPLLSRYAWLLVPGFVEILASHEPVTLAPGAHYSALLTGYALIAFVDAAGNLEARSKAIARVMVSCAAAASVFAGIFASPMEYWYYLYRAPNAHDALLEQTLATLPPDADVGAEDEIFAHLGSDPRASIDLKHQEWFVYDETHYSDRWHAVDEPQMQAFLKDGTYRIAVRRDGIVVAHRMR